MKITMPHWLTFVVGTVGTVCGSLVASNSFPALTPLFGGISAICTVLTIPTLSAKA